MTQPQQKDIISYLIGRLNHEDARQGAACWVAIYAPPWSSFITQVTALNAKRQHPLLIQPNFVPCGKTLCTERGEPIQSWWQRWIAPSCDVYGVCLNDMRQGNGVLPKASHGIAIHESVLKDIQ